MGSPSTQLIRSVENWLYHPHLFPRVLLTLAKRIQVQGLTQLPADQVSPEQVLSTPPSPTHLTALMERLQVRGLAQRLADQISPEPVLSPPPLAMPVLGSGGAAPGPEGSPSAQLIRSVQHRFYHPHPLPRLLLALAQRVQVRGLT